MLASLWSMKIIDRNRFLKVKGKRRERPPPLVTNPSQTIFYCQPLGQKKENLNSISIATKAILGPIM